MLVKEETLVVEIDDLHHPEKNVRIHPELQIKELQRSLAMFGQLRNIVIDEKGLIMAGNGLVQAIRGMDKPVKGLKLGQAKGLRITGLTENQKKKLMLADNRIYDLGVDDLRTIDLFLADLKDDPDIPGFDPDMLKSLLSEAEEMTEQLAEYGKLTEEQIEQFGQTEDVFSGGSRAAPKDGDVPDDVQVIKCPHCQGVIWV